MRIVTTSAIAVLLLLLVGTRGFAQVGKVELGGEAGLSFGTTTEDVGTGTKSLKTSFHAGALVRYWILQSLAIQSGLVYNNKGGIQEWNQSSPGFNYSEKFDERLTYLSIPIAALYTLPVAQSLELGFLGGPEFGFLMSAKSKDEFTFGGMTTTEEDDSKEGLKSFELGLLFGAMLQYGLPEFKAFVAYQFGLGLTRIHKEEQFKSMNRVHMFSLGVMVALR
jgi:hypothetical protein